MLYHHPHRIGHIKSIIKYLLAVDDSEAEGCPQILRLSAARLQHCVNVGPQIYFGSIQFFPSQTWSWLKGDLVETVLLQGSRISPDYGLNYALQLNYVASYHGCPRKHCKIVKQLKTFLLLQILRYFGPSIRKEQTHLLIKRYHPIPCCLR